MQNATSQDLPKQLLVAIAFIQGIALFLLHQAIDFNYWPHESPEWLFSLYSIALVLPTIFLLACWRGNELALLKWALPFALVVALLGFYTGAQVPPISRYRYDGYLLFGFVLCIAIATFKSLMYFQQWSAGDSIRYSRLFLWSWRNFLTLGLALLFAGCVWGILMLWGALFRVLEIDFFMDLFQEEWFIYPTLSLANGIGVIIFRSLTQIIDVIRRIQQALMKVLLVLIIFVSILFLTALPFTGLDPLWDSGGSTLILWMQALILFFVNSVYQDEPEKRPYPVWIHRFIYAGIALLPIYSVISFYGLSIRVDQHGWSLARCWGFLIWFVLALFPLGYLWGIIKRRDAWLEQLSRVNLVMGLAVLALVLLATSPVLDFRKISTNSQVARFKSGEIATDKLDIRYFYRQLGKPGYEALQQLKTEYPDSDPSLVLRIDTFLSGNSQQAKIDLRARFVDLLQQPGPSAPDDLIDRLVQSHITQWSINNSEGWYLVPIDLEATDGPEYLFIVASGHDHTGKNLVFQSSIYYRDDEVWKMKNASYISLDKTEQEDFVSKLMAGEIYFVAPRWPDIQIGGQRFEVLH